MKDSKTEFRYFSIPQWKQEERYLREQHKNGWKFVRVDGICRYHFQKCEPEDVVYQLDYNPDSVSQKNEYIQMFRDCGWEYLQDYVGYSYFRKAAALMDGEEEIFCDDASRADMMRRVFKGRMIPLFIVFFLLILPNLYTQFQNDSLEGRILSALFLLLFVIYLSIFVCFALRFRRFYKSLHE